MKNIIIIILLVLNYSLLLGQTVDSAQIKKEYTSLAEALKEPSKVYRLNLSNQSFESFPIDLQQFPNLEYLSFRNDHLSAIPKEISALTSLRVLDLSGNDFKILPAEFARLVNLEELYLNEEQNMDLANTLSVLEGLPNLKILHLEKNNFYSLPRNIVKLKYLDSLYLNDNKFRRIPPEVKGMNNLKFLDLHHNKLRSSRADEYENFGVKINLQD